jgi:hypothetical protein
MGGDERVPPVVRVEVDLDHAAAGASSGQRISAFRAATML